MAHNWHSPSSPTVNATDRSIERLINYHPLARESELTRSPRRLYTSSTSPPLTGGPVGEPLSATVAAHNSPRYHPYELRSAQGQQHGSPRMRDTERHVSSLPNSPRNYGLLLSTSPLTPSGDTPLPASPSNMSFNMNAGYPPSVFHSPQELAGHYGLPSVLPPVPRTTPVTRAPPPPSPAQHLFTDFQALKNNYLSMLSNKPAESTAVDNNVSAAADSSIPVDLMTAPVIASSGEVMGNYRDVHSGGMHEASPQFSDIDSFLTSPAGLSTPYDTPYEDFNTSPLDDSPFADFLNTPLITDESELPILTSGQGAGDEDYSGATLFPEMKVYDELSHPASGTATAAPSTAKVVVSPEGIPRLINTEHLYTISPGTPMIDSMDSFPPASTSSLQYHSADAPSPEGSTVRSATPAPPASAVSRNVSSSMIPTGTRKNITPESLVPLDAPTQPRRYITPSATSRKPVPARYMRRRRSQAPEDDEDEDELEEQGPYNMNQTEKEQIEYRRRQNTLAARKSRKRKLEYLQGLEMQVAHLDKEAKKWQTRAELLCQILKSHGVPFPPFDD